MGDLKEIVGLEVGGPPGVLYWTELEEYLKGLREAAIVKLKGAREPFDIGEASGRLNLVDELLNLPGTMQFLKEGEENGKRT